MTDFLKIARMKLALFEKTKAVHDGDRICLFGRATVWDEPTDDGRQTPFCISRDAFELCSLDDPAIELRINHEHALCSVGSGHLRLRTDDSGLWWQADLPDTPEFRKLAEQVSSGQLAKSSVNILGVSERVSQGGKTVARFRHIDRLTDVSLVAKPGLSQCRAFTCKVPATVARKAGLRARMRGCEMALRGQRVVHAKLAANQGLTISQLYAKAANGATELSGSLLYKPDGDGGWIYLGR